MDFMNKVSTVISQRYPNATVRVNEYLKSNDIRVSALAIFEGDSNCSPTIPLDRLFEQYKNGKSFDDIIEEVVKTYETCKIGALDIESAIGKYDPNRIRVKLLGLENNTKFLEETPHFAYGDLALCFSVVLKDKFGKGGTVVHTELLKSWGVSMAQLLEDALNNITSTVYKFDPIAILTRDEGASGIPEVIQPDIPYILSTADGIYGASAMLRLDVLKEFADRVDSNIFVVPLSTDECLLIPDDEAATVEALSAIISDINSEVNPPEMVLSDSVYYFDRQKIELQLDGKTMTVKEV